VIRRWFKQIGGTEQQPPGYFKERMGGPLPFTRRLEFEFIEALRLQVCCCTSDPVSGMGMIRNAFI
jgi:hypothetical protein